MIYTGARTPVSIVSVVAVSALLGCGTTATITRTSGMPVEARIVGADATNVYVENAAGGAQAIPKSEITDIDHPGDGAIVTGAVLGGYGLVNIGVGASKCSENGGAFCAGVFAPAAVGIPIMIWGFVTHSDSTGALHTRPPRESAFRPTVVPLTEVGRVAPTGASLAWRF